MKNYLLVLLGLLAFCSGCDSKSIASKRSEEAKTVESFIVDYYDVMSARDWDAYAEFFAEKAILTTVWADSSETQKHLFSSTISEFIAQTPNGPDSQPIFEEKPTKIDIEIKNNLAAVWVKYEAKFGTRENLFEWKGYDLFSLLKHNGQWYITSITYLSDEPA